VLYSEASAALDAFVRQTGIPVAETQAGKGTLAWDHPQVVGPLGPNGGLAANRLARDADLILAIGTRLADFTTASKTAFEQPDVRFVNLNAAELDAYKHAALPLVADARAGLEELAGRLGATGYHVSEPHRARVAGLREEWNAEVDRVREILPRPLVTQAEVIGIVNDVMPADATVVCAAGSLPGDLLKLWRTRQPGAYHLEYGYSCMGYEIAGGIGVKLAAPESEVVVMVGDGSYLMMPGELATTVQEGLKITVVLLDNHGFNCIKGLSESCGGRNGFNQFRFRDPASGQLSGDVLPIDFVANAASLGARAERASGPEDLVEALERARASDRASVIVVEVDGSVGTPAYESWWDVPVAEVAESATVRAARGAYEGRRLQERWLA
jgi:3D-(3,5/4)-trihydroxycyclohexane-1,2-dione acylhydrolase (decyclizing)